MIEPEESKISVYAILISFHNEFILQEQESGTWRLFGGDVKPSETNWSAMRRELFEGVEMIYRGAQVEIFNTYKKVIIDGLERTCVIYIIRDVDIRKLVLHKGKSMIIDRLDEVLSNKDNLNQITLKALEDYKAKYKL